MATPTLNPRLQALLPFLRPSTLAAMAADLQAEYADNGDPLLEVMEDLTFTALTDLVGETDAQRMIETAMEVIP